MSGAQNPLRDGSADQVFVRVAALHDVAFDGPGWSAQAFAMLAGAPVSRAWSMMAAPATAALNRFV